MLETIARNLSRIVATVALMFVSTGVCSGYALAGNAVNTGYFGGIAIMGYDTVAYFTEGRATKGSPAFSYEFLGETWHFSSAEHRDIFADNPIAYAPQYGGFCAGEVLFADVTTGVTTNIDPEAWRIIDGKLYLFYGTEFAAEFEANAEEWVVTTDANWPMVEAKLIGE